MFNNLAGHSQFFDFLIVFFAEYLAFILPVIFLFLLYRETGHIREKIWIFSIVFFSALFAKFVVTDAIRFFYHRPRPFLTLNVHQLLTDPAYSFPSAHTSFFFAFAFAIYLYNKKWGNWFFFGALCIGIARVMAGVHYPTDILGGIVVGFATSYIIFKYLGPIFKKIIDKFV